ncbi:hypothetical protein KP509_12G052100 [Ceratopteris richardii]|uniref:Uncharacterized protein n=1 Tax=Ceratopteris richardii TaxID=49495 RepID=A0A8T2TPM9_CERRI|nr:hypothetical protein KP509_12G052100 [Ceratopteris richardii]
MGHEQSVAMAPVGRESVVTSSSSVVTTPARGFRVLVVVFSQSPQHQSAERRHHSSSNCSLCKQCSVRMLLKALHPSVSNSSLLHFPELLQHPSPLKLVS